MPDIDIRLLRKQLVKMFNEFNRMAADGDDVDKVLYRMATRWSDILITLNTTGISIDAALSGISENPVQNKVINQKITQILQALNSINDLAKAVLPEDDKYYVIQNGVLVELPEGGSPGGGTTEAIELLYWNY